MNKTTPFSCLLLGIFLLISSCKESASRDRHLRHFDWVLTDSVSFRSGPADTLYDPWPCVLPEGKGFIIRDLARLKLIRYDRSGNRLGRIGAGYGEGPGEYQSAEGVAAIADTVFVFDPQSQTMHLFGLDGAFIRKDFWGWRGSTDVHYAFNASKRELISCKGNFYNYVYNDKGGPGDPAFYREPLAGLHDTRGRLLAVFGKRDTLYASGRFPYLNEVYLAGHEGKKRIYVAQKGTPVMQVFDLEGRPVRSFGEKGRAIAGQRFEPMTAAYGSPGSHREYVRLYVEMPAYDQVVATGNYILRFYREGIPYDKSLFNYLDKPLHVQIYDLDGELLADQALPDRSMYVHGAEGETLWVSFARSYQHEQFSYRLYKLQLK